MCEKWNRENADYFKSNYLQRKLEAATGDNKPSTAFQPESSVSVLPKSRFKSGLPQKYVQEVIGIQRLIIIEYLSQLLYQRFQEVIVRQVPVNTS
jgi:hypothetical protein